MPQAASSPKTLLLPPKEKNIIKKVNGHEMEFTNLDKLFWKKEKITKRDLLNYYHEVARYMLPYLKDRPQSLNRHPDGWDGKSFYQKDVTGKVPSWVKLFPYHAEDDPTEKNYMVVTDEAALLQMANFGCIEMNPWSSTVHKPNHPTWCILDLDPDKNDFNDIVLVARAAHSLLDKAGIDNYCKTSGSTGLHIYIPLGEKYTYEQSKEFARLIVTMVQKVLPDITSIERLTSKRRGKIYLDFLQNRPQATLAAPYSVRPKAGAPVSMPLQWTEVKKGLKITDFNIRNAMTRIRRRGDIFSPVLKKGIDMKTAIRKLEAIWNKES